MTFPATRLALVLALSLGTSTGLRAQQPAQSNAASKLYYGGSVTMSFSGATRIGIFPMVGYRITPQLSLGAKVGYEYVNYHDVDFNANNYGAGVFARFRFVPQAYLHGEYQQISFDRPAARQWVPFLLLGGGFVQRLSPRTSAFVEVLVDVLQDDASPYSDWQPVVSVGVAAGF
jgi:hypothetical protein